MKLDYIFLDMDGCCCDFVSAAIKALGKAGLTENDVKDYELYNLFGYPNGHDFWKAIEDLGHEFWAGINEYPWFQRLYEELLRRAEKHVIFVSQPTWAANSLMGKKLWLEQRFGKQFRNYIFTPHKYLLASTPKSVLIDDFEENVAKFASHGGHAILFPAPWNKFAYVPRESARLIERVICTVDDYGQIGCHSTGRPDGT